MYTDEQRNHLDGLAESFNREDMKSESFLSSAQVSMAGSAYDVAAMPSMLRG